MWAREIGSCLSTKCRSMQKNYEAIPDLTRIVPMPTCVEDELEALQERIDVGQLPGLVGFSWRIDRTRIGGVQLEDQISTSGGARGADTCHMLQCLRIFSMTSPRALLRSGARGSKNPDLHRSAARSNP